MPELKEEEAQARSLGLALLDAGRIYEGFVIPSSEGRLRRRRFPPHRRAIIGLVGRQRRFLRSAYTLADAGQVLEAIGPLRSMFEFLICQHWLAHDPDRNWKLWMERDHAARDLWRERLRQHALALHAAASASLTPEQRQEGELVAATRQRVAAELGDRDRNDRQNLEQRATQVGLGFAYDLLYRYESSAAMHPIMFAVDLLLEKHRNGSCFGASPRRSLLPYPCTYTARTCSTKRSRKAANSRRHSTCASCPRLAASFACSPNGTRARACRTGRNFCPKDERILALGACD
jgi:hypothetical protein